MNPQDPYSQQQPPQAPPLAPPPPPQTMQQQPYAPAPGPVTPLPGAAPEGSYSVDYLNTIAPQAQPKAVSKPLVFGFIGGIIALFGFVVFVMMGGLNPSATTLSFEVQDRLITLQTVTEEQQPRLNANKLSSLNVTLNTSFTSMNAELTPMIDAKKSKPGNKPRSEEEQVYLAKLSGTLEDAYLTGNLDRTYSSEISYELTILKSKLQKLRTSTKTKAMQEYYTKHSATLDATIEQLSEYNASL